MKKKKRVLHVIRLGTEEVVKTLDMTGKTDRQVEKIERGMLINLDLENYCIEDIEISS